MSDATIALCMIVRNEAPIIERCLASVRGIVDSWVICDTGSTDGTQERIEAALADLPGELHQTRWVDFGHNRSELLELAQGAADYLLLIDADQIVHQRGALPDLEADAYLLREIGGLDYAVMRLVRGDRRWWYEGSTHEYLATDGQVIDDELDELLVEHLADGASRDEKLLRDIGLLKRDLARDPSSSRTRFYLAQTYRDLGRDTLAVEQYLRRAEMGGWDEEVFYAELQAGTILARHDLDAADPVLLRAWQRRPSRAEPLYELARAHRLRGEHELATMFAERGLAIPYPDDVLFIHRGVYEWGLALEHALGLAGKGETREARAGLQQLLRDDVAPDDVQDEIAEALTGFGGNTARATRDEATPARLARLAPSLRIGEIKLDVTPDWPCFNPSIAADGDGFRMIVRTANYRIERGVAHADGVLHNINYLVTLDEDLGVTGIEPMIDRSGPAKRYPSQVQGFEDARLFRLGDDWYASATVCDRNPQERREIALLALDGASVTSATRLPSPDPERHEKNWMPLVRDETLAFVYACRPTTILGCEPATGAITPLARHRAPAIAEGLRGGSAGVPFDDGFLFAVHEATRYRGARRYAHRFVLLDRRLRLEAISEPFTFTGDVTEFCAGMARRGDDLVLSFGVSDAAAGLAVLASADVSTMLTSVGQGRARAVASEAPRSSKVKHA